MTEFMEIMSKHVDRVRVDLDSLEGCVEDPCAIELVQRARTQIARVAQAIDGLMRLKMLLEETAKLDRPEMGEFEYTAPLAVIDGLMELQSLLEQTARVEHRNGATIDFTAPLVLPESANVFSLN